MPASSLVPAGAHSLDTLTDKLKKAPRRRNFTSVPMILDNRDQWDAEAFDAVLANASGPKQSWDNTDLTGPWLNVMRNAMNVEIWGFNIRISCASQPLTVAHNLFSTMNSFERNII